MPPPEPGYVPSKALADFVRCRDLTCRWPGCDRPATDCDLDHTIPYADGRAHPCVEPQMLLPHTSFGEDVLGLAAKSSCLTATLILTSPAGHTYVTTPGSALLFPSLCRRVGAIPAPEADVAPDYCGERTAMMPTTHAAPAPKTAPIASPPNAGKTTKPGKRKVDNARPPTSVPPHRPTATTTRRHSDCGSTVYADATANRRHSPGTPLSS